MVKYVIKPISDFGLQISDCIFKTNERSQWQNDLMINDLLQTHLFQLHVIASPKGVAISFVLRLLHFVRNDNSINVFVLAT